jgi:hypothetical protein
VGVSYLQDCLVVAIFGPPTNLALPKNIPFLHGGIYAVGPGGFWVTAVLLIVGLPYVIFGKIEEKK